MKRYIKPHAETVDTELTRDLATQDFTASGNNDNIQSPDKGLSKRNNTGGWLYYEEEEDDW